LREIVAKVVRELMAEEMEALVGARGYERSEGRLRRHNGTRRRDCDTRVRTI
jgi:transposase-like protein